MTPEHEMPAEVVTPAVEGEETEATEEVAGEEEKPAEEEVKTEAE